MNVEQTSVSTDEIIPVMRDLFSKVSDKHHSALEQPEHAKYLHRETGVMVVKEFRGQPPVTLFAFFLPNTEGKLVRIAFNIETFNKAPKHYVHNMLKNLEPGLAAAAIDELEHLLGAEL